MGLFARESALTFGASQSPGVDRSTIDVAEVAQGLFIQIAVARCHQHGELPVPSPFPEVCDHIGGWRSGLSPNVTPLNLDQVDCAEYGGQEEHDRADGPLPCLRAEWEQHQPAPGQHEAQQRQQGRDVASILVGAQACSQ